MDTRRPDPDRQPDACAAHTHRYRYSPNPHTHRDSNTRANRRLYGNVQRTHKPTNQPTRDAAAEAHVDQAPADQRPNHSSANKHACVAANEPPTDQHACTATDLPNADQYAWGIANQCAAANQRTADKYSAHQCTPDSQAANKHARTAADQPTTANQ